MGVGKQRALRLTVTIAAMAALSGGTAWAAGAVPGHGPARATFADADETSTSVDASSTTSFEDGSTTTSVNESTTTSVEDSTTTTSFEGQTPTTVAGACKPGWGHGDKNHCHSGPPGPD